MAKEKPQTQLVKVVGTLVTGVSGARLSTTNARGIAVLKRSETLMEYAAKFLSDRGVLRCTMNQRADNSWSTTPMMFLTSEPKLVLSYVFTQFPIGEIGFYGKDLTKPELLRDFKFLKGLLK